MKRPIFITLIILGMFILSLIVGACAPASQLPAEATKIAQTVVAGAATVESAGNTIQTILTPISSPTPAPTTDLKTVCIPPLNMEVLTEVTLTDGRRVTSLMEFVVLYDKDGVMQAAQQAPTEVGTLFEEQGVTIKLFRCEPTETVYYDPESVK